MIFLKVINKPALKNTDRQLPAPYKLQENDWTTGNLTNNKRLLNCDNRRIETHQLLITSLHSQ